MNEFRITLISDPTDEFPNNKNNNFKVRLPTILNLPGDTWQASLWSVSVADEGHSPTVLSSNQDIGLIKYRYTFTQRHQAADNSWLVDFKAKDKEVTLKDVMGNDFPVTSGIQLWHNIITHMDQTMMKDVTTTSVAWKTAKNEAATVSLKSTWKPTFEWKQDTLVLKAVPPQDVYARDAANKVQPLSTVGFHVDFAQKFGLLTKDKNDKYQLGPNLDYALPTNIYNDTTLPTRTNQRYQWLGEHFVGIKPHDLMGGNELFKVKTEEGKQYMYLTRYVDWQFLNLNALFNTHVGTIKQTVMLYCDVVESTIVGTQKHSLLRKVELERRGQGRATVEPLHREWIRLRSKRVEIIEVSLATPRGSLLVLPTGKTLVTLGFRRV